MAKIRSKVPDYPKRSDLLREPKLELRNQIIRRQRMLTFRSVPVRRRIWWVTLTATSASMQDFKPGDLPASLTFEPQAFWCLSRRAAKAIVAQDQALGGHPDMYPAEYRLCQVCGRVLLGAAAHEYRLKQLKPASTWHFEQGPACNMTCKPHGRGQDGQPMRYERTTGQHGSREQAA